jgi:hypothetical protein
MKKIIILLFLGNIATRLSAQEQYFMGVTLTQQIYSLSPVKFGSELTDQQKVEGLMTDLLATRTFYSRDENFGCPTGKEEPPLEKGEKLPYHDKVVLIELEGKCPYGEKILAAQNYGAVAVIILQKEKTKEEFFLEPDEFAAKIEIPCFVLSDFEENERLMMYAPSPALLYAATPKIENKMIKNTLSNTNSSADLSVFPNPTSSEVAVNYKIKDLVSGKLSLFDTNGRLIHQTAINDKEGSITLDLSHLPNSIYNVILEATAANGEKIKNSKSLVKH